MCEYQAAEVVLRKMLQGSSKFITYKNDVDPSFIILRKHQLDYEKSRKTLKRGKKYFELIDLGSTEVTISELKDLEKQSNNKKYYQTTCTEFLNSMGLNQDNELAFFGAK